MQPRDYQLAFIEAVERGWGEFKKQLGVAPTGSGKTIIFSWLAKRLFDATKKKTLILAHREELIDQAIDKLHRATGIIADKEKAEFSARLSAPVVVASVQTMIRRLDKWPSDHFGLVVVDEAHHAIADSYQTILQHFNGNTCTLGVTATSDRGDARNLGEYFENIAHEISLLDLIEKKYLCPITIRSIPLKIDLSQVHSIAGDLDSGELGSVLEPYLGQIAREIKTYAGDRKTVCFLPLISTSKKFVQHCIDAGINAEHIDGESDDRKEKLARFHNGEFQLLSNAMLLTEGWDEPSVSCIVVLRPTRSRPLFCLDTHTEILTDSGWTNDPKPDQLVGAFNPKTGGIKYVPITGMIRRPVFDGEAFVSLLSQSVDIRVTDGHRMLYDHKRRTGWKFKTAHQLAALKDTSYIPVAGIAESQKGVPLTDHELRFIGWVMTDGNINKRTQCVSISQAQHQPWLESIQECIDGCYLKSTRRVTKRKTQFNPTSDLVLWTISKGKPRATKKHLRGWGYLEPWLSKQFALPLMNLTPNQFDTLIEAIHLGDGYKQSNTNGWTRRSYHICAGGDLVFAERLQITALRCGYRCNIAKYKSSLSGNWAYVVHLKKQAWSRIGGKSADRPNWKTESGNGEDCWCVENELGTIITRRNGKVAILGNCQMAGRGTRIDNGKENLLLLDFLWLHSRLSIVHPASLIAKSEEEAEEITKLAQDKSEYGEQDLIQLATDAAHEREENLRKKLAALADRKAKFISAEEFAVRHHHLEIAEFAPVMKWHFDECTEKQSEWLSKAGVDPSSVKGKGHASQILDVYFQERGREPASHKQRWVMSQSGWRSSDGKRGPFEATRDDAKEFFASRNKVAA